MELQYYIGHLTVLALMGILALALLVQAGRWLYKEISWVLFQRRFDLELKGVEARYLKELDELYDIKRQGSTHRCKVCKALWRLNPPTAFQPEGSWSVITPDLMGKCCDNEVMGDQIEPVL